MKTSTFLSLSTTVLFGVLDFSSATSPPPPGYYHREGHGKPGHPKSGYPTRTYPYNLGTGAPIIRTQPPEYTKPWETPVPRTGYELQPDVAHPYPPADPNVSIDDPSNLFDPYFPGIVIDFPDTNLIVDPVDNNDYRKKECPVRLISTANKFPQRIHLTRCRQSTMTVSKTSVRN